MRWLKGRHESLNWLEGDGGDGGDEGDEGNGEVKLSSKFLPLSAQ
jgi:hypothetical protein